MAGYGKQIFSTASIAVIIAVGLGLGVYFMQPQLASSPTSLVSTSSPTARTQSSNTTTIATSNPGSCSTSYQSEGNFYVNESSNLDLCVKIFYYSGTPINVVPTDQLSIQAYNSSGFRSAMSNFTVSTNLSNFTIGGSANENEGIQILYQIHANAISNGTYVLDLGWLLPQEQDCTFEFGLVIGNGIPNYTTNLIGHCVTQSGTFSNFPYPPNTIFVEVIGYSG